MAEYISSWWSVDLLPGWSADKQPECVGFSRDDGVGTLQISAHKYEGGTIPENDVRDFSNGEYPDGCSLKPVTCGAFSGVGVDFVAKDNFWLKRWLHEGPLLVYATYNCDAADRTVEISDVNTMLATLKSTDAG